MNSISTLLKKILNKKIGLIVLVFFSLGASATTISSTAAGGDWNSTSTWVGGAIPGAGDNVIIVSTATVSLLGGSPTNQTGGATLTINGILSLGTSGAPYKNSNYTLGGFSAVVVSGTGSQIYWNGNNALSFNAGTTFSITGGSSGCLPTGGSASSALIIGSATIAVSSTNSNNAAYSFADFNAQGGLPTFTMTVSPSSPACGSVPITVTVTPSATGVNPFTYTFSISPTSPALVSGFSSNPTTTSGGTTTQFTPANSTKTYTITCDVTATGDALATKTLSYTVNAGPTISAGSAMAAICQGSTSAALGGSYSGGGATSATWSDGASGGTFTNNTGSTPGTTTYTASSSAPSTVTLTLTTAGGSCNTYASKTVTVTPTVTINAFSQTTSTRCQGAGTVTTTTTANNSTGITYSLDATTAAFSGNSINSSTGAVTYAAGWSGTTTITASAAGCNGPATTTHVVTVTPTVSINAFSPTTSTRCQGAGTVTTTTTANNSTGITYSLDATTAAFSGNSINSSTGAVTYAAGWSGTTTITASAAGCNGPKTTTHVVTVTPTVTINAFSPTTSTRCQGAGTVTTTTTANNSTGITYSLDATTAAFSGNSIVVSTGAVTYAAGWSGTTTITASAAGCNGPATTTHVVTVTPTVTINAFSPTTSTRCQGAGVVTTTTTANNSTGITYSLDATTAAFSGNSINSSTGAVTYSAGWSGTTTITASAAGCNGPATTTHVVTVTPTVTINAFSPTTSARCQGAGTVTTTTTANNSTGITYSLDATTAAFSGNSINSSTGAVTYSAGWSGTTTITASAAGCNGPATTTHVVSVNPLPAAAGSISGTATVCQGATGIAYSVSAITNATGYTWTLPTGASIASGSNTNSITVNYSGSATSGNVTVYGTNGCGNGTSSNYSVTVNPASAGTAYWIGAVNSDWCNNGNWACGNTPSSSVNAIILSTATNMPVVNCVNAFVKDIDVQGTATLTIPVNKALNVYGSFVNTTPSNYTLTGTVNFAGTNQTIPAFSYGGLEVNGSGANTKTLAGPVTVSSKLVLINGIVVSSSTNTLTLGVAATVTAGSSTSYVNGPLTRVVDNTVQYEFPVGNGSARSIFLTPVTTALSSYTATYYPASPIISNVLGNVGGLLVNEYWDITRNSGSGDGVVAMDYINPNNTASWSGNIDPCSSCNVAVVQATVNGGNTNWDFTGGSTGGFANNETSYWQSNGRVNGRQVSSFGQFTFGFSYGVILPVTLTSFNAVSKQTHAELTWSFGDVNQLKSTTVEYSSDGAHFSAIANIKKNEKVTNYTYNHNLTNTLNYYRIRVIGTDGKETLSKTVLVYGPGAITIIKTIRPTLVTSQAFVDIRSASAQQVIFSVFDFAGRFITNTRQNLLKGENACRLETNQLAKGVYSVKVSTEDGVAQSFKIVKD